MGAEPGRRFLKQPAAKLEPEIVANNKSINPTHQPEKLRERVFHSLSSCSFTFTVLGGRSSLSELHSCTFLDSFWGPRQPLSLPKCSTGTDQVMLF